MTTEQILEKLIAFPVLGGDSNLTIINWIKEYIESFQIKVTLVPNEEGTKASLHCRIGPAVDGGIILSGHTDVVPVTGQAWDTDPFQLTDKGDGKLYGRGSCDMKGFIAICLHLLPTMIEAKPAKPIYFAFSYDEEIGCLSAPDLVKHIKKTYPEKPKYALIGEPSMLQPILAQKGIIVFVTQVNGSAGHSSRIKQQVSAVHEASRLVLWLETKMNTLIETNKKDARFEPPHTTIHVGQFNGGIAPNVIADKATFSWDLRTIPTDSVDAILKDFKQHCEQREVELTSVFSDFRIKTVAKHPEVVHLDTHHDKDIASLIQTISGSSNFKAVSFASEAGQFAQGGFESVICGPGSIAQAHTANEFIAKEQLQKGEAMLKKLIQEMSTSQS
ncbi:acetylornithine deacetylase [Rasiella sp. SM2506]|uniref:acetylornithine deacetylase n=1 Tax=Rasiella sp. SM2506 TaxID=3423914 RepID=UPI003D7AA247